jgi:MYXO-CTERM domain-containing protein
MLTGFSMMIATATLAATTLENADVCSGPPCERFADLELAHPGPIPFGGAVVLRPVLAPDTGVFNAAAAAGAVTVTVAPAMGGPEVPGEVVAIAELELLAWRPSAPLLPLTEYEITVAVDNSGLEFAECGPDALERAFLVSTSDAAEAPLEVPELMATTELMSEEVQILETLVCCDEAFPEQFPGDRCSDSFITWSEGFCAEGSTYNRMAVTATLDADAVAAGQGQIGYRFAGVRFPFGGNEAGMVRDDTFCAPVIAIHVMTGEQMPGPDVCVGQELAGMLKLQPLDPTPKLSQCKGEPYTCELDGNYPGWDSTNCKSWPDGQPTTAGETGADTDDSGETSDPTTQGATGEGPTSAGTSDESSGDESSGGDASAGGGEDDGIDRGCACASDGSAAPWGALVLVALTSRRRRRGSAR